MNAIEFVASLKEQVRRHRAFDHPLMHRLAEGRLTLDQIRTFGVQYYLCYHDFNRYIALVIPHLPDEAMRILMTRNLLDELGHLDPSRTHPEIFRRFLYALGLTPSDWTEARLLPGVAEHVRIHTGLCATDFRAGLAAIGPGTEWCVPNWFMKIVAGLRSSRSFRDEDLQYWTDHITLDVDHSSESEDLLRYYATSTEHQATLERATLASLDATAHMLDELMQQVFAERVAAASGGG